MTAFLCLSCVAIIGIEGNSIISLYREEIYMYLNVYMKVFKCWYEMSYFCVASGWQEIITTVFTYLFPWTNVVSKNRHGRVIAMLGKCTTVLKAI